MESKQDRKYLLLAILLTLLSSTYWIIFQINSYNTFHMTDDGGRVPMAMYYAINYPGSVQGFQHIIFQSHIAPDQWLLFPIFYLFPSPITLMIAKTVILSLTGLFLFFLARYLTKSPLLSLLFCFMYFINPGVTGMQIADYHVEILIVPLYLLTFYYYMRLDKKAFFLFSVLLLMTLESIVTTVIAFGIGLIIFEYQFDKDDEVRRQRMRLAGSMILLSLAALMMYNIAYYSVQGSYATNSTGLPMVLNLVAYPLVPLFGSVSQFSTPIASSLNFYLYVLYGLAIVFLGSGVSALFDMPSAFMFLLPWLAGVLVLHDYYFFFIDRWKYSYAVGGTIVAALLGAQLALNEKKLSILFFKPRWLENKRRMSLILAVSAALAVLLFLASFYFMLPAYLLHPANTVFLFTLNSTQTTYYDQLKFLMNQVPANASLMTQDNLLPYMYQRKNIELFSNDTYYFQPDYILEDLNANITLGVSLIPQYIFALTYINNHGNDYSILMQNGTGILLKRI